MVKSGLSRSLPEFPLVPGGMTHRGFPTAHNYWLTLTNRPGDSSIWTVSVLGQSPRQLREGAWAFFGAVSPGGTHVAFTTPVGDYIHEIWVMRSQGDNPQKVLALGETETFGTDAQWLPDGQRLAYC